MIEAKSLKYNLSDLEPFISAQTLSFHHQKHYQGYVNKLNELIAHTDFEGLSLEEIILRSASDTLYTAVFNQAAQVYNHEFYFDSLSPASSTKDISSSLNKLIEKDFSSVESLKEKLVEVGLSVFGSGYVWLVYEEDHLKVLPFSNALTPLVKGGMTPLLAIDVWEHAYYLDKQNLRAAYLKEVVDHLLDWSFVSSNLKQMGVSE
ncbi:MAG: superoxide dismutase [Alphaproteobacteria bacterium]|nr:superoxide dismutase [Alphaproteobacteria bacterium]